MSIPSDPAAERVIWLSIAQDPPKILEELRQSGLRREWFTNAILQEVVSGGMRLYLQSKDVSLLSLMSHCNASVGFDGWQSLAKAWSEAQQMDPIDWRQYVPSLKEHALLREVDGVLLDLKEQRQQEPHQVSKWMPHFLMRLRTALESGSDYSPTPSDIWSRGVPTKVIASTGLNVLDEVYRGGLRNGMVALWVIPTGHGKSSMTYTMAAYSVGQKHRVAVITTEARPFDVVAGTLQCYLGLTDNEVENKAGSDEIRDKWLGEAMDDLDRFLFVWGRDKGNAAEIEEVLYWVKPTHLILDHLSPMAKQHRTNKFQKEHSVIADFADFLEMACMKHSCTITVFSQMSRENTNKFKKNHDLPSAAAFGSAVPEQAASIAVIAMRHWSDLNTLYGLVKKDRPKGLIDTEFTIQHDPQTHSFYEVAE
jgi:hypothetical protein